MKNKLKEAPIQQAINIIFHKPSTLTVALHSDSPTEFTALHVYRPASFRDADRISSDSSPKLFWKYIIVKLNKFLRVSQNNPHPF